MNAALPQLHHRVHQVGQVRPGRALGQEREVLLQNAAVVLFLNVGQLHLDDGLLLGRQALLHVLLQSAQHHRLQQHLQLLHLLVGAQFAELAVELLLGGELLRLQEVEQRVQLADVVL